MNPGDTLFWHDRSFVHCVQVAPIRESQRELMESIQMAEVTMPDGRPNSACKSDLYTVEIDALKAAKEWATDRARILRLHIKQAKAA